jgi:hypothetical protein
MARLSISCGGQGAQWPLLGKVAVMAWYWWVLISGGIIVLFKVMIARSKPKPLRENELTAIFKKSNDEKSLADRELAEVVKVIADLFVVAPNTAYSNMLSRGELHGCVSNFMREAGITGLRTHTKMLHVVMSPVQITALVKLKPTEPRTAVREFIRIADDKWAYRTRQANDMEGAIRAADEESDRVVAEMKRAAASPPQPAPPQSPPSPAARRPTDPAAKIAADLSPAPLPRKRMNLLWVGPMQLDLFKTMTKGVYQNVKVANLASDEPIPAADLFATIMRQISDGQVTAEDIDWAVKVDAIAGEAESAFQRGDVLDAIEKYRDALQDAPGCDVYLMSMGTCYAELGALRDAVRYYERAAQISPQNAQIARNLAGAKEALAKG